MSRLVWTLPALAAVTLLTSSVEAQNNEERAVIAAAQAVFDAMEALDPEAFRNAMVPDGFLMAVRSETHGGPPEMTSRPTSSARRGP